MILKGSDASAKPRPKAESARQARRRKAKEPLDVFLTVRFNFGDQRDDAVTVMDQRRIPMVESVFKSRDRIVRGFVALLVKTGLAQPKVMSELFPVLKVMRARK